MRGRRGVVHLLPVAAGAAIAVAFAAWALRPGAEPPPGDDGAPQAPAAPGAGREESVPAPRPAGPPPPRAAAPPPEILERIGSAPPGRAPWTTLRLVDGATKGPPRRLAGASLLLLARSGESEVRIPEHLRPRADGAVEVVAALDDGEEVPGVLAEGDLEAARYRLRVPGYRAVAFPSRGAVRDAGEIVLQPLVPAARGVLVAGRGVDAAAVWAQILPGGDPLPAAPEDPPVPPSGFGAFEIHDLTEGRWRLEVRARLPEGVLASASREIEFAGTTVDLGEIPVRAPTTLLARVVALDGTPVLDPGLTVVQRAGPIEGRPGEDGWVAFAGVEPGVSAKVVSSLPGLEQEVAIPPDGGDEVRVELRWEEEGVRCRLRFLVDGVPPTRWGEILEGPELDKGAWKKDGFLGHDMAPGDYLFGIQAEPVGKSGLRRVWAKFTVPRQTSWVADVSFSEEPPR